MIKLNGGTADKHNRMNNEMFRENLKTAEHFGGFNQLHIGCAICNEGLFWGSQFDIKQKLPIITSAPVSLADEHQKNGPRNIEIIETNF